IEPNNDPRDFVAQLGGDNGENEEDEMENEFGGAGSYNHELNVMLQDILSSILGRPLNREAPTTGSGGAGEGQGPDSSSSTFDMQEGGDSGQRRYADTGSIASSAHGHGAHMPGGIPADGSARDQRRFSGMRAWTTSQGGTQVTVVVGSPPSAGFSYRSGHQASDHPETNSQQHQHQHQQQGSDQPQRPMFIDPEANAPLNLGNILSSLAGAFGRAQRSGESDGSGAGFPGFGFQMGNFGDYVWGQGSLDDIITRMMEQNQGANAPPPASSEAIKELPKRRIAAAEVDAKDECGICMDEYSQGEEVSELPCKHIYHEECINHWLKVNGTCPICRARIDGQPDKNAPGSSGSHGPHAPHAPPHSDLPGSFPSSPANAPMSYRSADANTRTLPEPESEPMD
ncbi:hypothetical protein GGI12_005389, partial [Dipsacomyces acuminosporus]